MESFKTFMESASGWDSFYSQYKDPQRAVNLKKSIKEQIAAERAQGKTDHEISRNLSELHRDARRQCDRDAATVVREILSDDFDIAIFTSCHGRGCC